MAPEISNYLLKKSAYVASKTIVPVMAVLSAYSFAKPLLFHNSVVESLTPSIEPLSTSDMLYGCVGVLVSAGLGIGSLLISKKDCGLYSSSSTPNLEDKL